MGHMAETVLPRYAWNSVWLALGVSLGVSLIGVPAAWFVTMCRFWGRPILEVALVLPIAIPAYVMAYAYTDFLQHSGPVQSALRETMGWGPRDYWFPSIRSLEGAILLFSFALYPYVYLLARAAFMGQSACAIETSRTLGCGPWTSFLRVSMPLARPAIAGGVALALMETLADFGTVAHFGVQTFTTGIDRAWRSMGDAVLAGQLSTMLLALVVVLLVIERTSRGRARFHHMTGRYRPLDVYELKGWRMAGAILACSIPVVIGFALPVGILITLTVIDGHAAFGPRYLTLALNSVTLAGITAVLAVAVAAGLLYAARFEKGILAGFSVRLAGLGYAVPGSVIAVGILIPMAGFDRSVARFAESAFGLDIGLIFTGTIAALIFAYLVRFLAVSIQAVDGGLQRITPNMDAAARSLGAGLSASLTRVHAPMMRGSLLAAALIVFVDVVKELPATLLLRPFNFDTLAVEAYRLASDERLAEASTPALAIVAVGLLPVILLSRTISKARPGS
jgi:iron(III) transport system permease protein